MDKRDINAQAEKYKQELLRLYGQRRNDTAELSDGQEANEESAPGTAQEQYVPEANETSEPDTVPEQYTPEANEESGQDADASTPPTDEIIFDVDEDADDDTAYAPFPDQDREESQDIENEYNSRYPEPDISDLGTDMENTAPEEYVSMESLGSAIGYILVNVRTGDESSAIDGATVTISATINGSRLIIASGLTNQSGTTDKFEIPAPDIGYSQESGSEIRPYSLYDVSVSAEGFFNARSVDVPVFAGITSVQNFSMIPVPMLMSRNDETLTYFNQEPDFSPRDVQQ